MGKVATSKLTLTLPKSVKELIERRAEAANYASAGEFVVELMREKMAAEERSRVASLLMEGLDSGPSIEVTPEYWNQFEQRLLTRVADRRKGVRARKK